MEPHLARIEAVDPAVNAIVTRVPERALEAASAADERQARGEPLGPVLLDEALLRAYLEKRKVTWPQLAGGGEIARAVGVTTMPVWVLLDGDRRIIKKGLRYKDLKKVVRGAVKSVDR